MNVREEDRQKSSCSGRGFGLAAAAIGVGVGAALYYFFNQRQEHPDTEGATSEGWQAEQPNALNEDSYSTISEHSTTDTSINSTTSYNTDNSSFSLSIEESDHSESDNDTDNELEFSLTESESSDSDHVINNETGYIFMGITRAHTIDSDWETSEWDVTNESSDIPSVETRSPFLSFLNNISTAVSPNRVRRSTEDDKLKQIREQKYRERSWTLEECSICFDVMLQSQEVMRLPCAHNFHSQCIMPWLQEKQTCPNCRKEA